MSFHHPHRLLHERRPVDCRLLMQTACRHSHLQAASIPMAMTDTQKTRVRELNDADVPALHIQNVLTTVHDAGDITRKQVNNLLSSARVHAQDCQPLLDYLDVILSCPFRAADQSISVSL